MELTLEQFKEKCMAVKTAEGYNTQSKAFTLPVGTEFIASYWYKPENKKENLCVLKSPMQIKTNNFERDRILAYGYRDYYKKSAPDEPISRWSLRGYLVMSWEELYNDKKARASVLEWLEKITPRYDIEKQKGVIVFTNQKTKETLRCDLNKQTFVRSYVKGKDKTLRYPTQFFRHVSGRMLIDGIANDDCANFKTLVDLVADHYRKCKNFGTFIVRMFDHIHLETYIAANVPFHFDTPFAYSDFDKDVRKKLNEYQLMYDSNVGSLFCSDKDTGRAVFAQIKDCKGFKNMVDILATNIQPLNTLVNHYNYDLKRLFEYCRAKNWASNRYRYGYNKEQNPETTTEHTGSYGYDLISYLRDYARMAVDVYGDNYEKYPADLKLAHDEVGALHRVRKMEIDAKKFEETIDKSLEWKNKEFAVVYPKTADAVITEGVKLRHCVGSYIQSVVKGECKILFLRKKDDIDKPFVTIEISGGNIKQARAYGNSNPTYDARMALIDYAKDKKLLYK